MTREERAREVLADHAERYGYTLSAKSIRAGDDPYFNRVMLHACLAFADAEAAAMRERAAMCADSAWAMKHTPYHWQNPNLLCDFIATAIRALPTTEVGK